MLKRIKRLIPLHPRAIWHSLFTYRRFLGIIKPRLLQGTDLERLAWLRSLDRCWQVVRLRVPIGRRIVVLAPHPDDESIGAGGLLVAHRHCSQVHIVNLFTGRGGGRIGSPDAHVSEDALIDARREELKGAGRAVGVASLQCLGLSTASEALTAECADQLCAVIAKLQPDAVLLPWYLDNHPDHRATNVLYAWSCRGLACTVFAYEIWTLTTPNAVLDITDVMDEKLALIALYETQLKTVDYLSYARGLAMTRGYLHSVRPRRTGFAEAFLAMPNRDYCDLVTSLYGERGRLNPDAQQLF